MTTHTGTCPFAALCERELAATPGLSTDEAERLEAHLATGCPVCEGLFAAALEAQDTPGLAGAFDAAAERMASSEAAVLARVEAALREDLLAARRTRRRHLRVLFWLFMSAASLLLLVAYVGTIAANRTVVAREQKAATLVELRALVTALTRYVQDTGKAPATLADLVTALSMPRGDASGRPYYPFEPTRMKGGLPVDHFGRPYVYVPAPDRALIYSVGSDARDDGGDLNADVVPVTVIFTRPLQPPR